MSFLFMKLFSKFHQNEGTLSSPTLGVTHHIVQPKSAKFWRPLPQLVFQ